MSKKFTQKEIDILIYVAREVDEVYVGDRKGFSQTKYVMEVTSDMRYWSEDYYDMISVPEELVGTWMMKHTYGLQYDTLKDCIKRDDWVRCKQVEKVITVWEEV